MKVKNLEKFLLFLVAFAALVVWQSSTLLYHPSSSVASAAHSTTDTDHHVALSAKTHRQQLVHGNNHERSLDPAFVLHIGPPKTATTTIQCGLHYWSEHLATADRTYFMGKTCPQSPAMGNNETAIAGHHLLMGLNGGNIETRGYQALKSRMEYHHTRGNHMVYSNEGFANHMEDKNITWQVLQELFVGWRVKVVIGYRHYFEWIRSLYYQQYLNAKKYKLNWPNQDKGQEHPSFLWYLDYHLKCYETGNLSVDGGHHAPAFGHHLSLSTYKKFAPYFNNIEFFNLYGHGDILTNFICEMLPFAASTCDVLKSQALQRERQNAQGVVHRVSKSFDAQRIAEAAYEQGMIDPDLSKPDVVDLIEQKVQETKLESEIAFLACPSPDLELRFLNASMAFEKEMLSISYVAGLTDAIWKKASREHKSQFQAAKEEFRFCEVDPALVLKDDVWFSFLNRVGKKQ